MLEEYKKKRDFSKTEEPAGTKGDSWDTLVFMVHLHDASHLHYDLRLELDWVLKSWAIPKGPSMDPDDKRLAMMVEDHPFEYKDFEGVIPEWEYGAGPTLIWDAGTYVPTNDKGNKKENSEEIRKWLKKGHVGIVLSGEKLMGRFDLIRTEYSEKKSSWLLVKGEDEFAGQEIKNPHRSVVSGKTLDDLRSEAPWKLRTPVTIEEGRKWPLPRNVSPMLSTLIDAPFDKEDWVFEIKWDGYRAIAEIENGKVSLRSRNGLPFEKKFGEVEDALQGFPDAVLDGEIVAFDEEGNSDFWLLQSYVKEGKGRIVYYVFDILYYDGKLLMDLSLEKRKEILKKVLWEGPYIKYSDHVVGSGKRFFELSWAQNLEGIMGKHSESLYRPGERSRSWVKIKHLKTQEAIICGYTKPRGTRKGFGALILGVYEKGKLVYVGHTGGGFTSKALSDTKKQLDEITREDSPFEKVPKTNEKATWVEPRMVCEVKFREWTKEGIMRQPVFLGIRQDKKPEEITKEVPEKKRPKPAPEELKKPSHEANGKQKIPFTNLEKIYFPEDRISKGDLISYYTDIAPFILPYLKDRPQTLVRYPNGIKEEGFYQKNVWQEWIPEWLCTEPIHSESEDRTVNYAVVCKDLDSILYMVNLWCIEFHPWSSRIGSLDYPDYVIFDLDPEDIEFKAVVKAAQKTYDLLKAVGTNPFCKTSGATGIHILVPTGGKYTFEQVTDFAKLINTVVHSELPDITSLERSPKKRQKKVYLDYLQNRRGQTIASVYSVRPRPWAPVSTPVGREDLNGRLKPEKFNLKNTRKRLNALWDIWNGMLDNDFDMAKALEKLGNYLK